MKARQEFRVAELMPRNPGEKSFDFARSAGPELIPGRFQIGEQRVER
jgi:hypothetical protein